MTYNALFGAESVHLVHVSFMGMSEGGFEQHDVQVLFGDQKVDDGYL